MEIIAVIAITLNIVAAVIWIIGAFIFGIDDMIELTEVFIHWIDNF